MTGESGEVGSEGLVDALELYLAMIDNLSATPDAADVAPDEVFEIGLDEGFCLGEGVELMTLGHFRELGFLPSPCILVEFLAGVDVADRLAEVNGVNFHCFVVL